MKRMKDFVELANMVDRSLPEYEQKEAFCDLLLKELTKMKGRDLAPYLVDCSIDLSQQPAQRLLIRFPLAAHVFNPAVCDIEVNEAERVSDNGACKDKI